MIRIYTALFMLMAVVGLAQQQDRIEIEMSSTARLPKVVEAGEQGLFVLQQDDAHLLATSNLLHMTGYDRDFNKLWNAKLEYNKRLSRVQYEAFDGVLYMVFNHEGSDEIEVITVGIEEGKVSRYRFNYFTRFVLADFCAKGDKVYLGGLLKALPIALSLDLNTGKITALPLSVDGKHAEVQEIFFSKKEEIVVVLSFENNKRKSVLIKSYRENQSSDLMIAPSDEYSLLTGKLTSLGEKSGIVIGTYALRNSKSTQGFYIGGFYDGQEVFKKYHGFSTLDNFFGFLSEKSQQRMEEKIAKKQRQGKDLKTKYRLLVHDVVEQGGDYIMLGEAYYPVYRTEQVRRNTGRGYYYEDVTVFDGFQYTHAVVVGFNKKGEMLWDHSFKITDTKLMTLQERVVMNQSGEKVTLAYSQEGEIHLMRVEGREVVEQEMNFAVATNYQADEVKYSSIGDAQYWYGNTFLTWGVQKIKNVEGDLEKKRRNVFYINRLNF